MKKIIYTLLVILTAITYSACKEDNKKASHNNNTVTENKELSDNSESTNSNDNRLSNAGEAKKPKGKMSYVVDGNLITVDENTVQCMYVGMNSTMAQSVISGGNQCMIMHMGLPKVGEIEIRSVAGMPSVSVQVIIDGVQYNNKKASDAKLTLTKITQDGKNHYVAGTFSGKLTSIDGSKTITVTDGVFESAYL